MNALPLSPDRPFQGGKVAPRVWYAGIVACLALGMLSLSGGSDPVKADIKAARTGEARRGAAVTEVILLRGLFNIFSYGMDELARKLEAQNRVVTVSGHGSWRELADTLAARHRPGGSRIPLVLIGHSLGANDIISMAARLGQMGVAVDLLIPIDATAPPPVPGNVRRVVNYLQSSNGFGTVVVGGPDFRGRLVNADASGNRRDLATSDLGHTTIDKNDRIHHEIVRLVEGLSGAVRPRANRQRRE